MPLRILQVHEETPLVPLSLQRNDLTRSHLCTSRPDRCMSVAVCHLQAGGAADGAEELTEEEGREILEMKNSSNIYTDMVNSIAPTVFGHSEVGWL